MVAALLIAGNDGFQRGEYSLSSPFFRDLNPNPSAVYYQNDCDAMYIEPQQDLILDSIYKKTDPHRAEINKKAQKRYLKKIKDLRKFENNLIAMANDYLVSGGDDYNAAYCTMDWLYRWAQDDALLGKANQQGMYMRRWSLATIASAYLQVRNAKNLVPAEKKKVEFWLRRIALEVENDYMNAVGVSKNNNHLNWGAWAVTITGVAVADRDLYQWGIDKAKYVIKNEIQKDGSLPLEMARGKRALQYHIFALEPLIMIAETAFRNGENFYDLHDGALHKLVKRTFEGIDDPSWFKEKSGYTQDFVADMEKEHFSWVEVYNSRFPNRPMGTWLEMRRPIISRRTGGNMTFLFYHGI